MLVLLVDWMLFLRAGLVVPGVERVTVDINIIGVRRVGKRRA